MGTVVDLVINKLQWLRQEQIWPNGLRYLWTDAFGVVLLVSLYHALEEEKYLNEAEWVVAEVERVLGRPVGIRIGEAPDRDGQYFHYLAMWLFALVTGWAKLTHYTGSGPLNWPGRFTTALWFRAGGCHWKMREDLSGPYPGIGFGALDAFHGYVVYRLLAPEDLAQEIAQMERPGDCQLSGSVHQSGSGPGHDALADPFLSPGTLGPGAAATVPGEP